MLLALCAIFHLKKGKHHFRTKDKTKKHLLINIFLIVMPFNII